MQLSGVAFTSLCEITAPLERGNELSRRMYIILAPINPRLVAELLFLSKCQGSNTFLDSSRLLKPHRKNSLWSFIGLQ